MYLKRLSLTHFRNHRQLDIALPDPSLPLYISGPNGAGKTSIAEAVYLLLTLRTFRQQPLNDIKAFNADYLRVKGEFQSESIQESVLFYQNERKLLINGSSELMSAAEYSHLIPVVCYSPSFESLLSSEHSERRQSLDRALFYLDKTHLGTIKRYNSLLLRKRAELDKDSPDRPLLEIINEQLSPLSEAISHSRLQLVESINTSVKNTSQAADLLMPGMELVLSVNTLKERDFALETEKHRPLYGAHKDLLYVKRNGKIIEKFQSFGQKKSCLLLILYHLALKISSERETDSVLIFDDFEAGLDDTRSAMLHDMISSLIHSKPQRQIILTGIANRHYREAVTVAL